MKKQKNLRGFCPYCKSPVTTIKGEDVKCENCGATVTSDEISNQSAVLQKKENGKTTFNFKNLVKKWWFWVAIASIIVLIIGTVVPSSPEVEVEVLYEKNQTVTIDDISIKVENVTETQIIPATMGLHMSTNNNYLVVLVTITNGSTHDYSSYSRAFKVYYNGYTYENKPTESYWYGYNDGSYKGLSYVNPTISSGLSEPAYLVFEVPRSIENAQYVLSFKPISTKVKIKLY